MILSGLDTLQWYVVIQGWLVEVLLESENVGRMYITHGGPFGQVTAGGVPVAFSNGDGIANETDMIAWEAIAHGILGF